MKKIGITGTNGFLGGYLFDYLKEDFEVVPILRQNSESNMDKFILYDSEGSILKNVDVLVHCAAKVHDLKKNSGKYLNEYVEANLILTEQLVRECIKHNVKRFIFISTVKVNGEYTEINKPFNSRSLNKPIDPYAISKYKAENIIKQICKEQLIEYVIIRSPLIYGPGVKANFLNLLRIINKGIPLPFASIKNFRSIIYIGNLVNFIKCCFYSNKASNKIFLISDPNPISTHNLVKKISFYLNKKNSIFKCPVILLIILGFLTGKSKQIKKLVDSLEIDYSETSAILDWEAPFSTNQGLKNTIDWYKENFPSLNK